MWRNATTMESHSGGPKETESEAIHHRLDRWFRHFGPRRPAPTPAFWSDTYELMATWPAVFSILARGHHPLQRSLTISSSALGRLADRSQAR